MSTRRTFRDVVQYLAEHPRVRMVSDNPNPDLNGDRTYLRYEQGLMWFRNADGVEKHLPINCGMTDRETGFNVTDYGFSFTKFGITTRVIFLDGPAAIGDEPLGDVSNAAPVGDHLTYRQVTIHDGNGIPYTGKLSVCSGCQGATFLIYELDHHQHVHFQCAQCGVSYCTKGDGCT